MCRKHSIVLFLLCVAMTVNAQLKDGQAWTGTWAAAAEFTGPSDMPASSLSNRSLRQVVHVSIGGDVLRVQFSNEFSRQPVEIKSVYIADAADSCNINVRSARFLTFNGKKNVTIAPGEALFSDALNYALKPLQRLSITINYGAETPVNATSHRGSRTTSYIIDGVSKPKTSFAGGEKVDHWYNAVAIDVAASAQTSGIAVLGNSITDGRGSTTNLQNRWTDFLAEALGGTVPVLNLGIGGNCVVDGGLSEPALKRFDRDILGQRGVKTLIIFEGVNDIGGSKGRVEQKTNQLIEAYKTLIAKAREKGLKVYLGTITPFKNSFYYDHFREASRQTVNEWIRSTDLVDGVIDFDAAVKDAADGCQLREELSEDWLHLNPKGYELMGKYAAKFFQNQ